MNGVVIYGAGGHARELLFQLREAGIAVQTLIDDFRAGRVVHQIPVLKFDEALERHRDAIWHVAIGDILARKALLAKLRNLDVKIGGFVSGATIVAPSATIARSSQIFASSVISDECVIGDDVIINFGCVISHNVRIGANSIIAPCVAIAGSVEIGDDVWVGIGSTIKNGTPGRPLRIGNRAIIGAGACVIHDVEPAITVVGVPARPIEG